MEENWPPSTEAREEMGIEKSEEITEIINKIMNNLTLELDSLHGAIITGGKVDIEIDGVEYEVPFKIKVIK